LNLRRLPRRGAALLGVLCAVPLGASAARIEIVARTGQPAPGTNGALFVSFQAPQADFRGRVVFEAVVAGGGATTADNQGIWYGTPDALELVAREGDPAPGVPGAVLGRPSGFWLTAAFASGDDVLLTGYLSGLSVVAGNDQAIWVRRDGGLELVAREGSQIPGGPAGVTFDANFRETLLDAAGRVAFLGELTGAGVDATNDHALFAERSGALETILRQGDVAPGVPGDVPLVELRGIARDADGPLLLDGLHTNFISGIWLVPESGPVVPFVLQQAAAPGGEHFGAVAQPCFDAGNVHFRGNLFNPDFPSGIWSGTLSGVARIVLGGDAAPGTAPGATFQSVILRDCAGADAVLAGALEGSGVDSSNAAGLWAWRDGALGLVARQATPIPTLRGVPDAEFEEFPQSYVNLAGDVAFAASLQGAGVGVDESYGLFLEHDGGLQFVARHQRLMAVAPGDNRRVVSLAMIPGIDDAGHFAFHAEFDDGSEAIVVAPEPASGAAGAVATGLLAAALRARAAAAA
jgi:hypothetical protein